MLEFLGSLPDDTNTYECSYCHAIFDLKWDEESANVLGEKLSEAPACICPYCGCGGK